MITNKILYILIFIIIVIFVIIITNNNNSFNFNIIKCIDSIAEINNNFLLKDFYIRLINIQTINYYDDHELNKASFYFKYKTITDTFNYNEDVYILTNIMNNINIPITNSMYKIYIPLNICTSLCFNSNINNNIIRNLFIKFIEWNIEYTDMDNYYSKLYSKALIYIIMYSLDKKCKLNIKFNDNIYNNSLQILNTDPIIISCQNMNQSPGFYSDGSYTYINNNRLMVPGSIVEGSIVFDVLLFAKYILNIYVSDALIDSYYNILTREYIGLKIFDETTGHKFLQDSFISYYTQIIFQTIYYNPDYITSTLLTIFTAINITRLAESGIYNLNTYPSLLSLTSNNINSNNKFIINTVNGNMRVINNNIGVTSFNYSSFCYNNDIDIDIYNSANKNTYLRYGLKIIFNITDNPYEYFNSINLPLFNIQSMLSIQNDTIIPIEIFPIGDDHASVGYELNENELFVAKKMVTSGYMIISYEILTSNTVLSINHITNLSSVFTDFVIFISTSDIIPIDEFSVRTSNYAIRSNYAISTIVIGIYRIIKVNLTTNNTVIAFTINRELVDISIRPDNNTICSGLLEIKEKRENTYMDNYIYIPSNFDPSGTRYFEMSIYDLHLGFVLYGPFTNVAREINGKEVIVNDKGVRYIHI
ncbi:unknown similar to AMEV195 [Choristoneura biennis entomopoxvirus]|uniref:Uncharacterized protein n=1 Tax=Choristoneura biennis entomopoxvirus TaxID=10288 RepID=A0A916KPT7_CBEPV|nr:unknown similar to AMEV195 [Choristoneura biennis entomopoxvirus]CCU55862.1 unknown similar to AMEV195 [Choristoneura biennis entomopoxvirus]